MSPSLAAATTCLKHNPPVNAGDTAGSAPTFVNPNLDVVYSEAWLAVDADTPVVLEIPEIPAGLYYTAQIVDEWAEITHNINERNDPDHPVGRFAICLAGSTPTIPDDCKRIDIPSTKAKLLTRVELADDVDRAVRLQHAFTVTSTGTPTSPRSSPSRRSPTLRCPASPSSSSPSSTGRSPPPTPADGPPRCTRRSGPSPSTSPPTRPTPHRSTPSSTRRRSRRSCTS